MPPISYPSLIVLSPINGESYASNGIWLNFTVIKPSDWFTTPDCHIIDVAYCIDGTAIGHGTVSDHSDANQVVVEVNDPVNIADPPSSFNFSFKLKGLGGGQHTLAFYVEGHYNGGLFSTDFPRTSFTVYTPSAKPSAVPDATSQPAAFPTSLVSAASVGLALAVMGLVVYFKKHKR